MPPVAKDLKKISRKDVECIMVRIASLGDHPRGQGCEKLSGHDRYRVRQGIYRILYEIKNSELTVYVVKMSHRSTVYNFG